MEERGEHGKVGGGARVRLDVDAPHRGVQVERSERPLDAQQLDLVDKLVAAIVPRAGQACITLPADRALNGVRT